MMTAALGTMCSHCILFESNQSFWVLWLPQEKAPCAYYPP